MSPIKKNGFGFTLIEVLIFISILVVILGICFSFLLITFSGSSKADALKEVKQNGSFALSLMEKFALSAKKVECSSNSLKVTMLDSIIPTVFSCDGVKISSNSSSLTDSNVVVSGCVFTCTINEGTPAMVEIAFTVKTANDASLRVSEKAGLNFATKVIVRNQIAN